MSNTELNPGDVVVAKRMVTHRGRVTAAPGNVLGFLFLGSGRRDADLDAPAALRRLGWSRLGIFLARINYIDGTVENMLLDANSTHDCVEQMRTFARLAEIKELALCAVAPGRLDAEGRTTTRSSPTFFYWSDTQERTLGQSLCNFPASNS